MSGVWKQISNFRTREAIGVAIPGTDSQFQGQQRRDKELSSPFTREDQINRVSSTERISLRARMIIQRGHQAPPENHNRPGDPNYATICSQATYGNTRDDRHYSSAEGKRDHPE